MSGEVAKLEPVQTPAAPANSEGAVVLAMIDKLIARPDVPVEKLEQMFALHQKVQAEASRRAYISALALMQPELPIVDKRGEISRTAKGADGQMQAAKATKYAKWEDVVEAISPILAKHGFSLSFRIKQEARVEVTAILGHRDGHCEETSMSLPIDDSGAKNNLQGWGSSVSYGKRYTAFALLNIVARGEDDDGKAAGEKPSATTVEEIEKLINDTRSDRAWFLTTYSIETLDDLTGKQRDEIKSKLTAKLANMRRNNARG